RGSALTRKTGPVQKGLFLEGGWPTKAGVAVWKPATACNNVTAVFGPEHAIRSILLVQSHGKFPIVQRPGMRKRQAYKQTQSRVDVLDQTLVQVASGIVARPGIGGKHMTGTAKHIAWKLIQHNQ